MKLVSGCPGELFWAGELYTTSWDAFPITHPHSMPFQDAVSELHAGSPRQVFTYSSNFLRLIVVLAYWHATLYNLCLAESYCHAFFIPLKLKTSIYTYTLCYFMRLSCSANCQFDSFGASPSTGSLIGARKTSWGLIKISLPGVTCLKQKPSAFCHQAKTLPALNMRHWVLFFGMKFKTASAIRCLEFSLVVKLDLTSIVTKLRSR